MKRVAAIIFTGLLTLCLFGCTTKTTDNTITNQVTSTTTTSVEKQNDEPQEIILADSNYIISDGYVDYIVELQNPNDDYAADFATITVTSRRTDGTIGFSDEWVVSNLMPGSDTYWTNRVGDGDTIETDTIEITVSVNDYNWIETTQTLPVNLYTFDNVSTKTDSFGYLTATGEITLNEDFEVGTTDANEPMIVCVLRDADGNLLAGFNGYIYTELNVGTPKAFDISSLSEMGDYATAEMYANIWL